ncbi:hypothetical protein Pint_34449 [Pistacia integerrima]|uniref:Uncharacterized protein n=1 Tax=Pistacia integerrima TaxID=434235 RepID=A0ACC0X3M7_9ROSI|nr:hypothetical protein Pint_34449 [Pistacia integerrima]
MATAGDEDGDAVLSDVEGEIDVRDSSDEEVSIERYRDVLAELNRERQARQAAENSAAELSEKFNRLKALAHESIKRRDEYSRQRDEALREKEEVTRSNERLSAEVSEANNAKDEILKQLDEMTKGRDGLKSEIENSAHMLVTGIDKISAKVSNFKNFSAGGLPRSSKYTGLPAVAYGVIKRTNEIVEELARQIDSTAKSRNDVRELMEQRNFEIAIEVSELEATISGLREEVAKKSNVIEGLEKIMKEKDEKIAELENQGLELKQLVGEHDDKLRNLETKMESQWPLLVDQLNYVSKIHDQVYTAIKFLDDGNLDQSELSESLFLPQATDMEENIRASLAGMESIYQLTRIVGEKTRDLVEEKNLELKNLNETLGQLVKEKEHIGSLLRSALSKRITTGKVPASHNKAVLETEEDEIYTLAGALENIVKESQLEIIELQHSVEELRAESNLLKEHVESQAKELSHRMRRIEELEEKERVANENVEGLMLDIAAAEEEITRWKAAAEQEADAGKGVEQEFVSQLSALKQELEEVKQALVESEKKLKFKEETAAAAMSARDAAEKSLRLADVRASRLRDRVEELSRQLEEYETREDSRGRNRTRYVCWPWQWLGMDFVGIRKLDSQQQTSNEMELSEPLV